MGSEGSEMGAGSTRKPRFLCLHGFRTNGEILKTQVSKWPKSVLDRMDLVYLDGPFPARGKSDVEGIFDPPYYEWFQFNKEFDEYENLEECLQYIEEGIIKHGPIDGLLGFSQGAILSAALPGLQAQGAALTKVSEIKYLIIVGGAKFRRPDIAEKAYASGIQCPSVHFLDKLDSIKDVLGTWGKKAAEATKKSQDIAGDMWQHLKTGPSFADAAVGRIAQGTKVFAEGGYEKLFRQTFETVPEEKLLKPYACYLSTSAGPVMGILYLSSAKLAFCSDNPLSYKVGEETQWSYYKVVIPLHQLKAVNPSTSKVNSAEKYIQIISIDNHEFWFMAFVNYDSAVKNLKSVMEGGQIS